MKKIIIATIIFLIVSTVKGQSQDNLVIPAVVQEHQVVKDQQDNPVKERLNFFVFTKEIRRKVDWQAIYTLTRARMKSFFHHRKLKVVRAHTAANAAMKIEKILNRRNKLIGNIWFDSHGHYGNRYSSFRIGTDQFSYKNIKDSNAIKQLKKIALYCDQETKVGLGSCYAGADFYFPATDSTPASRMNGDSLMTGLGNIFKNSCIYASESWVMAKPGIFKNRFGFAGYPLNKSFRDKVYAPVWERIGDWKEYCSMTGEMRSIPTIALDKSGNIRMRTRTYNTFHKSKRKIARTLKNLKPGLATFTMAAKPAVK